VIEESSEFGARAGRRLREEVVVWMTTVTPAGTPVPRPVWFIWDGEESALVYSRPSPRVRNIEANPRVTLNFDGDGGGGDVVILSGTATIEPDAPPADRIPDYMAKYDVAIAQLGLTPESFAEVYDVPLRVRFTRLYGH
jgi:PPOX class probable F420-dependent enzyme